VAIPWIESRNWPFDPAQARPETLTLRTAKIRVSNMIERLTGRRPIEHRTFQRVD
jgi:hypothetical protein